MKTLFFFLIVSFTALNAFSQKPYHEYKRLSVQLNDEAADVVMHGKNSNESLQAATKILDRAIAADSLNDIAYGNQIRYLCMLKDYKTALSYNERLCAVLPNTPEIIQGRGLLLYKLNRKKESDRELYKSYLLFKAAYAKDQTISNLKSLVFNTSLVISMDAAVVLLNKEKYKFTQIGRFKNELDDFEKYILPRTNKDNAI